MVDQRSSNDTYNSSSYATNLSWNTVTDADLAGFRPYASGMDVAHWARGATVVTNSISTSYIYRLLDGNTSSTYSYRLPMQFTVKLSKLWTLHRLRVWLRTTGNYRYRVETSVDGKSWSLLIFQDL